MSGDSAVESHPRHGVFSRLGRLVRSRPLVTALVVVLVVALAGGGIWWATRDDGGDGEFVVLSPDEDGPDPFTEDVAEPAPSELNDAQDELDAAGDAAVADAGADPNAQVVSAEAAQARVDALITTAEQNGLSVIAPASPQGVGLYGGSGVNACDKQGLVGFLEANPDKAAAFAQVQGITVDELPDYIDGLTAGFLLADTTVVNHGFKNGEAYPIDAILEAGTAVLVDDQGIPRARCKCGNPLTGIGIELDGQLVDPRAFADDVVDSQISADVVSAARDPRQAIGPPDCSDAFYCANEANVSLGTATSECEFYITVRFVDNALVNGPGDDLRVVETGAVEPTDVYVEVAGQLQHVGRIEGGDSSIDLSPALPDGTESHVVRLCDVPDAETSTSPGADIDAIAALNSTNS